MLREAKKLGERAIEKLDIYRADYQRRIEREDEMLRGAAQGERARIREELLAEVGRLTVYVKWDGQRGAAVDDPYLSAADLLAEIKRICGE